MPDSPSTFHLAIIEAITAGRVVEGITAYGTFGPAATSIRAVDGEQTNFSYIVDNATIWKFYATAPTGIAQEVRIGAVLDEFVPGMAGYLTQDGSTICVVTRFIPGAVDLWQLRHDAVLAHKIGDLGTSLGHIHAQLARALGTHTITGRALGDRLRGRLSTFRQRTDLLDPYLPQALDAYALLDDIAEIEVQEIHGDLHLGQIVLADDHLYYLDFEGEPGQVGGTIDSTARDVAGLARSFHYAGLDFNYDRFAAAYEQTSGKGIDHRIYRAYLIDRLCYEVIYELSHRPDWVHRPLDSAHFVF